MRFLWRRVHYIVPIVILGLALGLQTRLGHLVEPYQLQVFDAMQRLNPRLYQDAPVRIVDIDEESIARFGQWPWPRTELANLLYQAFSLGAAALAFDVVFADPDRTSPGRIVDSWPDTKELADMRERIKALPDHDGVFRDMIGQTNVVTGFVLTQEATQRKPMPKWGIAEAGDDPRPFLQPFEGAVLNLPAIEQASSGNGSFNLVPEQDNVIRRVNMFFRIDDQIYPSLSAELLRVAQGAGTFVLKASGANLEPGFGAHTGLNNAKIGALEIPTDGFGRLWLHYTRNVPSRYIPAWRLLEGRVASDEIEGRLLLVGTSAEGLRDIRATPLDPATPGVEIHANIIEQILLGHYLSRPDWAPGAETTYLLVLGLLLIFLVNWFGPTWAAAVGTVFLVGALGASWYAFTVHLWLLDPVMPSLAIVATYLATSSINLVRTEAERRQIRGAFGQYLSPALVEQLADNPSRLRLGGETRKMTFLFCDIRGFTPISEQFKGNPQGLTLLINRFLTPMTDVIMANGGTIDKYMGDCIMAFWNAPLDVPDHAERACTTALQMIDDLAVLNAELKADAEADDRPFISINVGIGLNTGECVVGNMGSLQRFDYSVLGDAVNLAARLEGQSKTYGATTVIGEETHALAQTFPTLELDLVAVKGKSEAVRIYTLLGRPDEVAEPSLACLQDTTNQLIASYRSQDWLAARRCLAEGRANHPDFSDLWDLYEDRIDLYEQAPPGPDWDGVFVATTK